MEKIKKSNLFGFLFVSFLSVSCSSLSSCASPAQTRTYSFSVVAPNVNQVSSQADIVPFLETEKGSKIPFPSNVPLFLKSGEQIDITYLGFKGYTVDVICSSFYGNAFSNIQKIIVNQTHEEVPKYFYYLGEVRSFGKYHFFTIETNDENSSINGNYSLESFDLKNINLGKHIFAGLPSNGQANHIAKLEVFDSEDGEEMYAGIWDYGEILFE